MTKTMMNKTSVYAILASVLLLSISLTTTSFADKDRDCDDKITDKVSFEMAKFNKEEIRSLTSANQQFISEYANESLKDVGVAFIGETDKKTCTATITNISHQFVYEKDNERNRISVSIDPKTMSVVNYVEMKDRGIEASGNGPEYTEWAGWAVRDDAGQSSSNIDEIKAYWSIPTITDPSGLDCGTGTTTACNFTVWAGQTDAYDGNDMIAQAVTNSHCAGNNCGTTEAYDGLLQFRDNGSFEVDILCDIDPSPTINFDKTDDVFAKVKYYAITDQYTLYLENETDNEFCSTAHTETFELPRYGQFQAERPANGGSRTNLGQVSDFYMEGYFWDNGVKKGLDDLDGTGYDWWEFNIGTSSSDIWVDAGSPRSTDDFLIDYISSS